MRMLILKQKRCKAELFSIIKTTFCVLMQGLVGKCRMIFCHCLWGMQLKYYIFPRYHFWPPGASVCVCVCHSCLLIPISVHYTVLNKSCEEKKEKQHSSRHSYIKDRFRSFAT